ncbi:unnamed protein product, partial [Pedinophyceae sp. YPF-701]
DTDGDNVADEDANGDPVDNCPLTANAGQADLDGDGCGDACEGSTEGACTGVNDRDGDGVTDDVDECLTTPVNDVTNVVTAAEAGVPASQVFIGCPDTDRDGVSDNKAAGGVETGTANDNCPAASNPTQADLDGDGEGDACDSDVDGDGVANADDTCPDGP